MPLLSGFLLAIFQVVMRLFLKFFDVKKAWILSIIAITFALMLVLYAAGSACIDACMPSAGAGGSLARFVWLGWGLIWNGVTAVALSCWVTVWAACTLYVWKKKVLNMLLYMA